MSHLRKEFAQLLQLAYEHLKEILCEHRPLPSLATQPLCPPFACAAPKPDLPASPTQQASPPLSKKLVKSPPSFTSQPFPPGAKPPSLKTLSLEPLPPFIEDRLTDVRRVISEAFPSLHLLDTLAEDGLAHHICQQWSQTHPAILIVFSQESAQVASLLEKLQKALSEKIAKTQLCEASEFAKQSPPRMVIVTENGLPLIPEGMLKEIPLFALGDLTPCIHEIDQRRHLWQRLVQTFEKHR